MGGGGGRRKGRRLIRECELHHEHSSVSKIQNGGETTVCSSAKIRLNFGFPNRRGWRFKSIDLVRGVWVFSKN